MLADKSGLVSLLMEKPKCERPLFETLSPTKPSHTHIVVHRDTVEEIYRRSPAGGFERFPHAYQKPFHRISANSAGGGYRASHTQTHGRDVDN